MLAVMHRISDL